ncbi:MAG TPA: hypothetical protein VN653_02040 [Anaerolineales bacterium]|nr:hypothetical protein [Anaerolineales bacterium]
MPRGLFDAGFETFYQNFARTTNGTLRHGFQFALFAAIWISPLLIRRIPPITLHARETRERALAAMEISRFYFLRQMLLILKNVAALCYGANREVRDAIGYPRQPDDLRNEPNESRSL